MNFRLPCPARVGSFRPCCGPRCKACAPPRADTSSVGVLCQPCSVLLGALAALETRPEGTSGGHWSHPSRRASQLLLSNPLRWERAGLHVALPSRSPRLPSSLSRDADRTGATRPDADGQTRSCCLLAWMSSSRPHQGQQQDSSKRRSLWSLSSCPCFFHLPPLPPHPAGGSWESCLGRRRLQEGQDAPGR